MSKQPPPTPQEIERGDQPRLSVASLVGRWYWCYPPLSCGYIDIQSAEGDTPFERHDPPYACGKWVSELPNDGDDRYDYSECHCAVCNSLLFIPIPMGSSAKSMHARYYRSGNPNTLPPSTGPCHVPHLRERLDGGVRRGALGEAWMLLLPAL